MASPTTFEIDLPNAVATFVPGAIAGDALSPGDTQYIVILGLAGALTADYIRVNDQPLHKHLRILYRVAPLLGVGTGYGLARLGGFDVLQSMVPGLLGGAIAGYVYKQHTKSPGTVSKPKYGDDVPSYPAFTPTGPPVVPGSLGPLL